MTHMHVLITAGPTQEPLDPVRFLTNYSTGNMGYAAGKRAVRLGHSVTLISGPVSLKACPGARMVYVQTAREMFIAIKKYIKHADCLIMTAAVADFSPVKYSSSKIKRDKGLTRIDLRKTQDILTWAGRHKGRCVLVGFCMETHALERRARAKMLAKNADMMAANQISPVLSPFGRSRTNILLLAPGKAKRWLRDVTKATVARIVLDNIQEIWYKKHSYK